MLIDRDWKYEKNEGAIVDACIKLGIETPRHKLSQEQIEAILAGRYPAGLSANPDAPKGPGRPRCPIVYCPSCTNRRLMRYGYFSDQKTKRWCCSGCGSTYRIIDGQAVLARPGTRA